MRRDCWEMKLKLEPDSTRTIISQNSRNNENMVNYINTTVIIPVCSHNDSPHVLLVPFPLTKKLCGTISDVFFGELPILSHKASTVRNFHIYLALNIYTCMHTEHLFLLGMLPNTTSSSYSRSFVFKYPSKLVGHFLFMLLQHGNNCV